MKSRKINFFIAGTTEVNQQYYKNNNNLKNKFREDNTVMIASPYKAKGNEARWVFLFGLDRIAKDESNLKLRKQLFTAITRTKGFLWISGLSTQNTSNYSLYQELEQAIESKGKVKFINKTDSVAMNKPVFV